MRPTIAILLAGLALIGAPGASAQTRDPAQRQTLTDLAYVLGQSHALRQACAGAGDQFWRTRMAEMVAAEHPNPIFDRQLKLSFNNGFAASQSAYPRCGAATRRAQGQAAARGNALASSLTGQVADDDPSR